MTGNVMMNSSYKSASKFLQCHSKRRKDGQNFLKHLATNERKKYKQNSSASLRH